MTKFTSADLARITISPITQDDQGRFTWTVKGYCEMWDGDEPPEVVPYEAGWHTNGDGEGLWAASAREGREDSQVLGTWQFSLNCSASTRRRRVIAQTIRGSLADVIRQAHHLDERFDRDPVELYRLAERA